MTIHLLTLATFLVIYLLLGFSAYGWGKAAAWLLRLPVPAAPTFFLTFWLGWCTTLFLLELLHLLLPINAWVALAIFLAGILLLPVFRFRRDVYEMLEGRRWQYGVATLIMVAVACWVASRAMLAPTDYDTGLYHLSKIRWINSHAVVPGLANLHGRLSFNNSFFTYVAALNFHPFLGWGRCLANSFLTVAVLGQCLGRVATMFQGPRPFDTRLFQIAPSFFAWALPVILAFDRYGLESPTPNFAVTLLQLVLLLIFLDHVSEQDSENDQRHRAAVLMILAATAITLKLNTLAYSTAIALICFVQVLRSPAPSRSRVAASLQMGLPPLVILLVWALHSFITAGVPVYPSTLFRFPVDWAIPVHKIQEEADWIRAWARKPGVHPNEVLGNWDWLQGWYDTIVVLHRFDILAPLKLSGYAFAGVVFCGAIGMVRRKAVYRARYFLPVLPIVAGLLFWFFTAPDPRFLGGLFWLLSIWTLTMLLVGAKQLLPNIFPVVFVFVLIVANRDYVRHCYLSWPRFWEISTTGVVPPKAASLSLRRTDSGLDVYVPVAGDQCWDGPLPCANIFRPELRLRGETLQEGFTVQNSGVQMDASK